MKYIILCCIIATLAAYSLQVADYNDINHPNAEVVNARESRAYNKLQKPVVVLCRDSAGIALVGNDNAILILTNKSALGRILLSTHCMGDTIK